MTDTIRTLSALQTLLADNTTGAISPQDLRDAIISGLGYLYGTSYDESATIGTDDIVVATTAGAAGITITLPAAASSQYKYYVFIRMDSGAGTVTIDANDAETINGATTYSMATQYDYCIIWCDGTEWLIVSSNA